MPAIISTNCENNKLTVIDQSGSYEFDAVDIPNDVDSITQLENYLNDEWLPSNVYFIEKSYQIKVHIFSVSPLVLTVWAADLDVVCPSNWWE